MFGHTETSSIHHRRKNYSSITKNISRSTTQYCIEDSLLGNAGKSLEEERLQKLLKTHRTVPEL